MLNLYWCIMFGLQSVPLSAGSRPADKRELAAWRVECELGLISDEGCPVDGGWGPWAPWSACRGPCDAPGRRIRTRACNNPSPSEDGLPCTGPDQQSESCFQSNCTVDHYRELVRGDSLRTQALIQLEIIPALAARCLRTECGYDTVKVALSSDNTWQIDPESFWNSLLCVKHNLGCEVVGEWGSWGEWSACGARCGPGLRWRVRHCDTPPPSTARVRCAGASLEAARCLGEQCARGGAARWGAWTPWTPCSDLCTPGVTSRQRTCIEKHNTTIGWDTNCAGQHEEYEICKNAECVLNGGWSGWSGWGPCSRSCGAGRRLRARSCTRPARAGGGARCLGPRTEFGACYLALCDAHSHVVAVLSGDSSLHYDMEKKQSALFHLYIRFLPLGGRGVLARRGAGVRVALWRWHVCADARGSPGCAVPRVCWPAPLEPGAWHAALLTVSNEALTLRLDDALEPIKASFPCDPELPNVNMNIHIGERFRGEIHEIAVNFIPLNLAQSDQQSTQKDFSPSSLVEVAYGKADLEEAFLPLHEGLYVRVPCFDEQDEWKLELTVKPQTDFGTLLFMKNNEDDSWLQLALQYMRLKLKLVIGDYRSESSSATDYPPEQWLDVVLIKKKDTTAIEALLNSAERLHVLLLEDREARQRRNLYKYSIFRVNETTCDKEKEVVGSQQQKSALNICNDEFFIGGVPLDVTQYIHDELTLFSGVIASMSINNVMQDLHGLNVERSKRGQVQLSMRSASVSGTYREVAWGSSNRLSLTCLHTRSARSPHSAHWLRLDTTVDNVLRRKSVRAIDDGQVLKLDATADKDLRGFYTCRAHTKKGTRNIVTYGVTGKVQYNLTQPDRTTAIVVVTTVLLVIATLSWLVIEGIHDLKTGFGFFRDAHLTPEEEAEAVCSYIDDHAHQIGSDRAVRLAKARARYRAKQLVWASKASFAAQEPEGLMQIKNQMMARLSIETDSMSDEELPELPLSCRVVTHEVYKCEPSYVSSPRHGTLTSPRSRLSSSENSPRLLIPKRIHSLGRSLWSKKHRIAFNKHFDIPSAIPTLPTIKSSSLSEHALSPAKKILKKFQQLRCDD